MKTQAETAPRRGRDRDVTTETGADQKWISGHTHVEHNRALTRVRYDLLRDEIGTIRPGVRRYRVRVRTGGGDKPTEPVTVVPAGRAPDRARRARSARRDRRRGPGVLIGRN